MMKSVKKLALPLVVAAVGATQAHADCVDRGFTDIENKVLDAYIAYYGRPADPAGLAYWAGVLEAQGGDLSSIISAFGNEPEFLERYGSLSSEELVNNIYQQLFNRDADAGGLAWYVGLLDSGEKNLQNITLDIMGGATGDDAPIVSNRKSVAQHFVSQLETADVSLPSELYNTLMSSVAGSASTADAACMLVDSTITAFGGVLDGGDTGNGGDNGGDNNGGNSGGTSGIVNQGSGSCIEPPFPSVGTVVGYEVLSHIASADATHLHTTTVTQSDGSTLELTSDISVTFTIAGQTMTSTSQVISKQHLEVSNNAYYMTKFESYTDGEANGIRSTHDSTAEYSPADYQIPTSICDGMSWYSAPVTETITGTSTTAGQTLPLDQTDMTSATTQTVESLNETLTVPAGTFSNIIKFRIDYEEGGYSYQWFIKNGLWLKIEDYSKDGVKQSTMQALSYSN